MRNLNRKYTVLATDCSNGLSIECSTNHIGEALSWYNSPLEHFPEIAEGEWDITIEGIRLRAEEENFNTTGKIQTSGAPLTVRDLKM